MGIEGNSNSISSPETTARREWSTPQLVRLGDVAEITSKVDTVGRNDGGVGTKKRT